MQQYHAFTSSVVLDIDTPSLNHASDQKGCYSMEGMLVKLCLKISLQGLELLSSQATNIQSINIA